MHPLDLIRTRILPVLDRLQWVGPFLVRASLGAVFATSGWGKLHNLGQVTSFFTELGIPAPGFNAVLASGTELVGGLLLLTGLFTRLAAVPLIVTMTVAILTAKRPEIDGVVSVLSFIEFTYIAGLVWLVVSGAGLASLDGLLSRRVVKLPRPLHRSATAELHQG